ncbi:MAG: endonuclease III [Vampirovibrionales bacterium]|nr:endonuclease III [Vampirovibrionales bacterium]
MPSAMPGSPPVGGSGLDIDATLAILERAYPYHPMSEVTGCEPFRVLVACLLSLRSKDELTMTVCEQLFPRAQTPQAFAALDAETLAQWIYPIGFYRNKARTIIHVSQELIARFGGAVPDDLDALLTLKGVGRKTANLVVSLGFDKPAICVDTHVHRIMNRLGYIDARTPEATEMALRAQLPPRWWRTVNRVLVCHGKDCCKPIGAQCDRCPVAAHCAKIAVKPRPVPAHR